MAMHIARPKGALPAKPSLGGGVERMVVLRSFYQLDVKLDEGRTQICKRATSRRFFSIYGCCKVYSSRRESRFLSKNYLRCSVAERQAQAPPTLNHR
jgi:hypothetical protein